MACLRKGFFSRRFTQIERRADWRGLACLRKSIFLCRSELSRINTYGLRKGFFCNGGYGWLAAESQKLTLSKR